MSDHPHSPIPIHRQLSSRLAAQIDGGRYPPGSRLPSEARLATEFGVSRGTLRQALATLQREGRIEAVAARGHFVKTLAPAQAERRRKLVGVVVPSVAKPYVPDILVGLEDELHLRGYTMLVGSSGASGGQQAGRVQRILEEGASGLIAYPVDYDPDPALFARLNADGFPVVLIDRYLVGHSFDAVTSDNLGGAYAAVRHLIDLGHRRIAFVSTDNLSTTSVAERLQGYRQALVDHGIEPEAALRYTKLRVSTAWPGPDLASEKNARRIAAFLERIQPTAVFALHDHIAVDVLAAAERLGRRVPEELAVIGFDDDPFARALAVPLSTVAQPRERIGRLAAQLVLDRIEGRRSEIARIVVPTTLVVRRSSQARLGRRPDDQPRQAASA